MPLYLGMDTSNYTTSAAVYDSESGKMTNCGKLLPVKKGTLGLRQSDAVFHHTRQLPEVIEQLNTSCGGLTNIAAVGASSAPRSNENSYMPCFLCGEGLARSVSALNDIPMYRTTHQKGHILAAVYSCGHTELLNAPFIAFHVSGGTTDCLYVTPDSESVISVEEISTSLDLHAGQAVDRVGTMLSLDFPCGKALEALALKSSAEFKIKPTIKDGSICLSGLENRCRDMLERNVPHEDVARYCIEYISSSVAAMTDYAVNKLGSLPLLYAGGVMSDSIIRERFTRDYGAFFASPAYSCDNAAGVAFYTYLLWSKNK